ncbi:DUF4419 domain-containing protein [Myxococcaceae bacterium GXIMD 01537]
MAPSVTFAVDDVIPTRHPIQEYELTEALASRLKEPVIGTSHPRARFVEPLDTHPLIAAVHHAFSDHRPLVLSPDIIWLTIAQGLALHVVRNAEALRLDLVKHQGRKQLVVARMELDFTSQEFCQGLIGDFSAQLRAHSTAIHDLVVCDFSTTGPVERVVSQVLLMDTMREYFDYVVECICGIPTVTLEGTPEDWIHLKEKVAQLPRYGLDWWARHLLPICDEFIRAAQGHANVAFWRALYKLREMYGGQLINGWICKLFPFTRNAVTGEYDTRNPVFAEQAGDDEDFGGLASSSLPTGLSRVPLILQLLTDAGTKKERLAVTAGFLGVTQSPSTLAVRPETGWVIHEDRDLEAVLRRVRDEHPTTPPLAEERFSRWLDTWEDAGLSADIIRRYRAFDGASLFDGPEGPVYRIRGAEQCEFHAEGRWWAATRIGRRPGLRPLSWTRFCDLRDGGFLAYRFDASEQGRLPIVWVRDAMAQEGELVAENLGQFLLRALDSEGEPYFQHPGFTRGARIALE